MKNSLHTAILVFAQSSKKDMADKGDIQNEGLFDALTTDILAKVARTGLPYFHFDEQLQKGATFGERFVNAIAQVYGQGYDAIITIGNDTPQVTTTLLKKAAMQLTEGKTVVGPSTDGGFYLMGLHKDHFNADHFLHLPWQRFGLLRKLFQTLQSGNTAFCQLPMLSDIDRAADIPHVLQEDRHSLYWALRQLLSKSCAPTTSPQGGASPKSPQRSKGRRYFNKGSPVL